MEQKKETLGVRLRRLRNAKGLTADEVAKHLKVATSTYREWEYGRAIRGEPYFALAEILGSTLHEILMGDKYSREKAFIEIDKIEAHVKTLRRELEKSL